MAKAKEKQKEKQKTEQQADIHFVGLMKTAPGRYAVVTGTVMHPIIDTISQPLEYAAETMKVAVMRMLEVVP